MKSSILRWFEYAMRMEEDEIVKIVCEGSVVIWHIQRSPLAREYLFCSLLEEWLSIWLTTGLIPSTSKMFFKSGSISHMVKDM